MKQHALVAVLMFLFTPAAAWAQNVTWRLPGARVVEVEFIRAQSPDGPGHSNAFDIIFQGAAFLRLRTPEYHGAHMVLEVPAAFLAGRVPACVDAPCTRFERSLVMGNPLLGVSYRLSDLPLSFEAAYRFPTLTVDPWEPVAEDNWQRGIDELAANAALRAIAAEAEEALTPRTSSVVATVIGELKMSSGVWSQLKAGMVRVSQQAGESFGHRHERNSRTDFRYDVRLGYDFGGWRTGAGLSGQSTLLESPARNCEVTFRTQCDNLAQFEVMSSYAVGRWSPVLLLRWPVTEYLKRRASWTLAVGLAVDF